MDFCLDAGFVSLIKVPGTSKRPWTDLLNIFDFTAPSRSVVSCHGASLVGVQPCLKSAAWILYGSAHCTILYTISPAFVLPQKQTRIYRGDLRSVMSRERTPRPAARCKVVAVGVVELISSATNPGLRHIKLFGVRHRRHAAGKKNARNRFSGVKLKKNTSLLNC